MSVKAKSSERGGTRERDPLEAILDLPEWDPEIALSRCGGGKVRLGRDDEAICIESNTNLQA